MPRAVLPIAVLAAVLICAISGFGLVGLAFGHSEEHNHTITGHIDGVVVEGASGDVSLMAASVEDVTIHERRRYGWREPRVRVDLRDGVLHVRVRCGSFSGGCADDLDIVVPHGVRTAAVRSGSGDISLAGLTGDVFTATTDSGKVRANRITGAVRLRSDSGDIQAGDISGAVAMHTDSGDVDGHGLTATATRASSNSGDVRVRGS
jgi:hypothetical protein